MKTPSGIFPESKAPEARLADILIIDDSPADLHVLSQLLSDTGYTVRVATRGVQGLRAARIVLPGLILLDVKMPGMDGYETCRQFKSDPRTRSVPIIFLSALDSLDDKVRAFASGGVDYITKPFQPSEVLARVQTHLARREAELQLLENYRRQKLINDILQLLYRSTDPGKSLERVLEHVGRYTGVCRVYVIEASSEGLPADGVFEWCDVEGGHRAGEVMKIYNSLMPLWRATLEERGIIVSRDLRDIPEDAASSFTSQGILSILVLPIYVKDRFYGLMGLDVCREQKAWEQSEIGLLLTVSKIVSGAVERKQAEDALLKANFELKAALAEVQKAHDGLDQRIRERTAQLVQTNVQLRKEIEERKQAEEAAKAAEHRLEAQRLLSLRSDRLRALGEMAAGIAHELNQPLVGVRGMAEHLLLAMERGWNMLEEKVRVKLEMIIKQADRMAHIIEHVRLFSREAGRPEVRLVGVNDVVGSAVGLLGEQLRSRGIRLECRLGEELPFVLANPFSLEEVLLNLMINARDALEERREGSPGADCSLVTLRTFVEGEGARRRVTIEVSDEGIGIPEDVLPRAFDAFFTTKSPEKGTGLGLSISRSIIQQFGGEIHIETRHPVSGTAVGICLPAAEPEKER